jgi:hypothetical protein
MEQMMISALDKGFPFLAAPGHFRCIPAILLQLVSGSVGEWHQALSAVRVSL